MWSFYFLETNFKHIMSRTAVLLACLAIAEAIPQFEKYMALFAGLSVGLINFVFPPLFYYWLLVEMPDRSGGPGLYMWLLEIMLFGIVSAILGLYATIDRIVEGTTTVAC